MHARTHNSARMYFFITIKYIHFSFDQELHENFWVECGDVWVPWCALPSDYEMESIISWRRSKEPILHTHVHISSIFIYAYALTQVLFRVNCGEILYIIRIV